MKSRKARDIAVKFQRKINRLDETRRRIEAARLSGNLHLADVEATYAGLFLQAVVAYETAIEDFVLGLLVRPGGIRSTHKDVRARVNVRNYAHAMELAGGPGSKYPSWIGRNDLEAISNMLLHKGLPFKRSNPPLDWSYVQKAQHIRNAIAHPSEHAMEKFRRHVIQNTPLPKRERTAPGYLRGRATGSPQTRWELFVAGLNIFINDVVK